MQIREKNNTVVVHAEGIAAPYYVPGLVASLEDAGWRVGVTACSSFPKEAVLAAGLELVSNDSPHEFDVYAPWEGAVPAGAICAKVNGRSGLFPAVTLSLGRRGSVKIASYEQIVESLAAKVCQQDYAGKKLLLTMGPTIEDFDPARYISNRSTGRMGVAFARMAARRGAHVIAVCGPMSVTLPKLDNIEYIPVRSAKNMGDAVLENIARADIAILCAAVADFSPCNYSEEKIKKGKSETLTLRMKRNMDILATVGSLARRPYLVGFAAESTDVVANAQEKMERKNCDMLCANDITAPGCGFAGDTNSVHVFIRDENRLDIPLSSKAEVADKVLDIIIKHIK